MRYILGIDPAYSTTGYAVLDYDTEELIEAGKYITSAKLDTDERSMAIIKFLLHITDKYGIKEVMLEDGFAGKNPKTGQMLAMLRGGIICVMLYQGKRVYHMLPSQIRNVLGIGGNAKKEEVAEKVTKIYSDTLKILDIGPYSDKQNADKTSDIYDAISIGYCYIKHSKTISDVL